MSSAIDMLIDARAALTILCSMTGKNVFCINLLIIWQYTTRIYTFYLPTILRFIINFLMPRGLSIFFFTTGRRPSRRSQTSSAVGRR